MSAFSWRCADLGLLARKLVCGAALLVLFAWSPAACLADQRDPRLDDLFEQLRSAETPQVAAAATRDIWAIWNTPNDESLNELMREGSQALDRGELLRAVELFSRIIDRDRNFAEGWNKRATAYYQMQNYEGSIRDVEEVLRLEPRHFAALSGMGLIYSELGADAPAMRWFERALEVHPFLSNVPEQIETLRKRLRKGEI